MEKNSNRQDSNLRKKYGIREQPRIDAYKMYPVALVHPQPRRFSPFKAGSYHMNGYNNIYLKGYELAGEVPKKYLNNVEKISKIDSSCPKSFKKKITSNLENLV